ncbi:MAG: daunorubicin resistance protein DrrA family ABC transporter ATP-binding protein [Litorilinea sp.]|nr:MAG: daunorubicin resistance protein DrrA family ABC transporter ATP-binding protein [Litorilinea sp.]
MTLYLAAHHVQKRYGRHVALQDASLTMHQGEVLALLGPNGAGKTTFIKILATLLTKDAGEVQILGHDLDREPEAIRHLLGYVGQDTERSAYARLTVAENLRFFGRLRGLSRAQIEQRIEKLAHDFDFTANLDKLFVTLSGGQKQTVVIMRALLHDPPLVYLDEPTKGLDPIIARKIRTFLCRLVREEGKSLLLTSHILSEVDEMADRVALIQGGRIPIVGHPDELKAAIGATEFVEVEKAALPPAVVEKLLGLEPVLLCLERNHGWLAFGVSDIMTGAEAIIRVLREEGVVAGFRHHSATLEDAFIYHIGELDERFER